MFEDSSELFGRYADERIAERFQWYARFRDERQPRWLDGIVHLVLGGGEVDLQWALLRQHYHIEVSLGDVADQAGVQVSVGTGLVNGWLTVTHPALRAWIEGQEWRGTRTVEIALHHGSLWWRVWTDPDHMEPTWRNGCWTPLDDIFGYPLVEADVLRETMVAVGMPERSYPGVLAITRRTWRRPRWPWWPMTRARTSGEITFDVPVPIPGKGDNGWDMEDDAVYSAGAPGNHPLDIVEDVRRSIMDDREQRSGDRSWMPGGAV